MEHQPWYMVFLELIIPLIPLTKRIGGGLVDVAALSNVYMLQKHWSCDSNQ